MTNNGFMVDLTFNEFELVSQTYLDRSLMAIEFYFPEVLTVDGVKTEDYKSVHVQYVPT
jgi:hypothetical protein